MGSDLLQNDSTVLFVVHVGDDILTLVFVEEALGLLGDHAGDVIVVLVRVFAP